MSDHTNDRRAGTVTPKPFRFLDLPKDIRLCVYDQLDLKSIRRTIPLKNGHSLDILCHTIPGIHILATNRLINDEASAILNPLLKKMDNEPPVVIIEEEHLDAFHQTSLRLTTEEDLIDRIMMVTARSDHAKFALNTIHLYRRQKLYLRHVKRSLRLNMIYTKGGFDCIRHLATFILRCVHYVASSSYQDELLYPPFVVTVEMSSSTDTTVQRMMPVSLPVRLLINPWTALFTQPRHVPMPVTLSDKIHLFALRRIATSHRLESMSTFVFLLYKGTRTDDGQIPDAAEEVVRGGVGRALQANGSRAGYLQYGGAIEFTVTEIIDE